MGQINWTDKSVAHGREEIFKNLNTEDWLL
jgi:hypothetical protein